MTHVELRFSGGPHHGLVVEGPPDLLDRLPHMAFTVLASGQLFDLAAQVRLPARRVAARPVVAPSRPAPPTPQPPAVEGLEVLPFAPPPPALRRAATVAAPQFLPPR